MRSSSTRSRLPSRSSANVLPVSSASSHDWDPAIGTSLLANRCQPRNHTRFLQCKAIEDVGNRKAVSGVMIEVVCYDVEPTAWASAKGRHWLWVRPLLHAGLDELVRHWRL